MLYEPFYGFRVVHLHAEWQLDPACNLGKLFFPHLF
jgi:hypothetical protein